MQRSLIMQELLQNDQADNQTEAPLPVGALVYEMSNRNNAETQDERKERKEAAEEAEKKRKIALMMAKRTKFFKELTQNEVAKKPDRNQADYSNVFDCQQITIKCSLFGDIFITKDYFMFAAFALPTPKKYAYVINDSKVMRKKKLILRWRDIEEVTFRKYLNMPIGVDIQTNDKRLKSFNLMTAEKRKKFHVQLDQIRKHQQDCFRVVDKLEDFKKSDILSPWLKGEIQNQELILKLNKYASRSFNDLNAYPIFPWVLTDYKSDLLSFKENKKSGTYGSYYRDLGQPTTMFKSESEMQSIKDRYEIEQEKFEEYGKEEYEAEAQRNFMDRLLGWHHPYQHKNGFSSYLTLTYILSRFEPYSSTFIEATGKDSERPENCLANLYQKVSGP